MANLYLSHWNASEKVIVPGNIVNKLKSHHVSIVRSIYKCLQKKFLGVVINYDEGINIPLAFQALWQALIDADKVKLPFLIVVSDDNVVLWHYHLSQLGKVSLLSSKNHKEILESTAFAIILVPQMNTKLLQSFEDARFSFMVIEDFDKVSTKRLFKRLSGEFSVALTRRNFMVDCDYKTMWHILNWTNPGLFGKLNDFERFDRDHLMNIRNPYQDIWYKYNNNMRDSNADGVITEKADLQNILNDWAKKNNLPNNNSVRVIRKRKSNSPKSTKSKSKKKKAQESERVEKAYHEQVTQLIGNRDTDTLADTTDNAIKGTRKLRDVSDLNYTIITAKETVASPKKAATTELAFQPPFLRNTIVRQKSFEFRNKKGKEVFEENLVKVNDKQAVVAIDLKQNHIFPSLEDILSFRKKTIYIPPKISGKETMMNYNKNSKANITKQDISTNSERINITSLEEVFRCKRKLVDNPQISKKLPTKKTSYTTIENKHLQSHSYNEFKKLNLGDETISCPNILKSVTMITRETQTGDNFETRQETKDIAVGTDNINFNSDVPNSNSNNLGKTKGKQNSSNSLVHREIGCEDIRGKQENLNSIATLNIHDDPLQNVTSTQVDNEHGSILLSIIDGKFPSQIPVGRDNDKEERNTEDTKTTNFTRRNGKELLSPLFGDQVSCNDANSDGPLDEDATDETFSTLNLSKLFTFDNQYSSQLRVKTIHQINKEDYSETSQKMCESLKILYGDEVESSKSIFTDNSAKHGSHNLISSLFG